MVIALTVTRLWCMVLVLGAALVVVDSLNGDHVCMVQQKYNITKRVKYRAPMSVRTYEWCFSMPPRCSKWKTEMRELTKLETDERIAEVAVCCPGYKMKDVSCVPICPNGRTGHRCSEDCPDNKWGPNCVHECDPCKAGICSPITGECSCEDGWQGESCEIRMPPSTSTTAEDLLTKSATKTTPPITSTMPSTRASVATTLETTPTTLTEFTTRPNSLKPVIEPPVSLSNRTVLEASISSQTPLLESTFDSTIASILATNSSSLTEKPTATVKATTPVGIVPMTTNISTTTLKIVTTEAKTNSLFKKMETTVTPLKISTIAEVITENSKPTKIPSNKELPSIQTSTVTAFTEQNTTIDKTVKILSTTTSELPKTKPINIFKELTPTDSSNYKVIEKTTPKVPSDKEIYQTKTIDGPKTVHELKVPVKVAFDKIETIKTTTVPKSIKNVPDTSLIFTTEGSTKTETAKRPQSTIRYFPTTIKFKPKEIWIRPAQKGEPYKSKTELNIDLHNKPRPTQPNTTPKTIIVSIIPTSVSYATFKKLALSTTSLLSLKTNTTGVSPNAKNDQEVTKPMSTTATTESSRITLNNMKTTQKFLITSKLNKTEGSNTPTSKFDQTTTMYSTFLTTREFPERAQNGNNSMTSIRNLNSSNSLTTSSTNSVHKITQVPTTKQPISKTEKVTRPVKIVTVKPRNVTIITVSGKNKNETVVKITKSIANDVEKTNATFKNTNQVTTESTDDEEFHILTEPEHITAVMEGKGKEKSSVDLVSVISIAGGIMMAVITVAVIIVMVERCKRPRYEDGRKVSDIRMQVMIDSNDVPPPYVRSIFHTPLPDPPTSEKCHYQPISTLDRNLKQFMRPVVVQSISPIMLENFRGILECHYDHLPRRSHHHDPRQCTVVPSTEDADELTRLRPCSHTCSAMESTIEALKCEAKQDVIDSTTSEPLYAEIPCWRPPSEHAVEVLNLNGEAVTEL